MIPIYRAKKIDSDEYIIGYYYNNKKDNNIHAISVENDKTVLMLHYEIDPTTLEISFDKEYWISLDLIEKVFNNHKAFAEAFKKPDINGTISWIEEE